jgi:isopentenyl diphosphate isomerase/L-lactate dehydrogenase-like FMN-dependent dehydrogenase
VLVNITGGYDMTLFELDEAANEVRREVDPNANIILGSAFDTSLEGRIRVSVVAAGLDAAARRLPILLKGILNPDDARRAVEMGMDGVIVSNHGGRILDTVPATIEALPFVVEAVAGAVPVLVDGGIRRGTDILKALALGAKAVLIGRPCLHGLAAAGAPGVAHVLHLLRAELEVAMALTGRVNLAQVDRAVLWPPLSIHT